MHKEIYTQVTIDEGVYSIRKFDALTGLHIARLLLSKVAPLLPLLRGGASGADWASLGKLFAELTDEELTGLARKCLRHCSAMLPAGPQPLMDERGEYGIEGLEYDLSLVARLCYEAIKWGATDFFGAAPSALSRIATSLSGRPRA